MANIDIRRYAKFYGVPFWKIAEHLNISEPTLTRRLRKELEPKQKIEYKKIIEELGDKNANA